MIPTSNDQSNPLIVISALLAVILSYPLRTIARTFICKSCQSFLSLMSSTKRTMKPTDTSPLPCFTYFIELGDDLIAQVLSFVADVPFENKSSSYRSNLTHVLPVISKNIHRISSTDFFWKSALERLLLKDPSLWEQGISSLLPKGTASPSCATLLIEKVVSAHCCTYRTIFQRLTSEYIRYSAPIFHMRGEVELGVTFGLHLFEPRYRYLISQIMVGHDTLGEALVDGPSFIYAHSSPLAPETLACVVQVQCCRIYHDGSSDVFLVPKHFVVLEKIWELPKTGRLYKGQCVRVGSEQLSFMQL